MKWPTLKEGQQINGMQLQNKRNIRINGKRKNRLEFNPKNIGIIKNNTSQSGKKILDSF